MNLTLKIMHVKIQCLILDCSWIEFNLYVEFVLICTILVVFVQYFEFTLLNHNFFQMCAQNVSYYWIAKALELFNFRNEFYVKIV